MSFETKTLKQTADGTPGPQMYNKMIDDFQELGGIEKALNNIGPRIIYNINNGTGSIKPANFGTGVFLAIDNKGSFIITLQINSMVFTIYPGETHAWNFNPFTSFAITTTSTYSVEVGGF